MMTEPPSSRDATASTPARPNERSVLVRLLDASPRPCPGCGRRLRTITAEAVATCPACGVPLSLRVGARTEVGPRYFFTVAAMMISGGFGGLVGAFVPLIVLVRGTGIVGPRTYAVMGLALVLAVAALVPGWRFLRRPSRLLARPEGRQRGLLAYAVSTILLAGVGLGLILRFV